MKFLDGLCRFVDSIMKPKNMGLIMLVLGSLLFPTMKLCQAAGIFHFQPGFSSFLRSDFAELLKASLFFGIGLGLFGFVMAWIWNRGVESLVSAVELVEKERAKKTRGDSR